MTGGVGDGEGDEFGVNILSPLVPVSSPVCSTSPWAARGKEARSPCSQAHSASQFLSLDAGNGQNSSPASLPCADHWKQLQAQHPSFHLEIRRNGLRAASFPSISSKSKCQKPFLTPCCKTQTSPIKLLHRQMRNKFPLPLPFPVQPFFTGRVNIHREHSRGR